jgi:hypothetical protein
MRVGGRQGDNVTTTGEPEHSLVDPALGNETAGEPILDGDDIVVEPGRPASHTHRRARALTVAIVIGVLLAIGIAVAIATRGGSGGNTHVTSSAPVHPPAANPPAAKSRAVAKPKATPATTPANVSKPPMNVVAPPASVAPTSAVAPPVLPQTPVSAAQTTPTPTMPTAEPPSVLRWTTSPSAVSIPGGGSVFLNVTVANPTAGTVTLPHPMSCPPTLQPVHGSPVGGAVCTEIAQIMAPHSQVVAHYTIYATNTANASGAPLAPGAYIVNIENLHNVKVTVTAH